ncbi:hypothetical protein PCANC_10560 [Puccinia coronata f. sp. avenae]|uniref:Uncharacterized protein n=1 Tax=Puccinia coronata f. sp. avenae TaxID=200324 RepID=A0A2N5VZ58_9BASI|nr:hypothetical protein PCANC_10560 [Puccinia coronata f. sp. avenae]
MLLSRNFLLFSLHRLTPNSQAECAWLGLGGVRTFLGNNPFHWSGGKSINEPNNRIPGPGQPSKLNQARGKQALRGALVQQTEGFIPQITGSSAGNWRQTKHGQQPKTQPPPGNQKPLSTSSSNIALILAKMQAQQEDDQLRCHQDEYCARRKADLDKQSHIMAIIASVAKHFWPEDILKPNGSNIRQWERMVWLHAAERFSDPDVFLGESDTVIDPSDELVARGIIHASINSNLTYNLLDLPSAADVYLHLVVKFRVVNQAS